MAAGTNNPADGAPDCVALVVSAGRGARFGGDFPKQYAPLAGFPLLRRSLALFARHPRVNAVLAVIHADDEDRYAAAAEGLGALPPVPGGATRQDSVRLGLESLVSLAPGRVLIHDSVRPLVAPDLVDRVLDALAHAPGAIPALPMGDTLKRADEDGSVAETVSRAGLWRAQTPQGFQFTDILAAHRDLAGQTLTDDAAVAEAAGIKVAMVPGAETNLKVTTPDDLELAERLLGGGGHCVGYGFDVHRFTEGTEARLCGVAVPHDRALAGHSDADVGLHALTDALLGAIGGGDIGEHFPPSDPQWHDADSASFLRFAAEQVRARGGRIANLDVTIICEAPKIAPHRAAMRARIAEIAGVPAQRVNVKATTTEGLGFTGRREGIAAQAVAAVQLRES